ncbi:ectoine synthase [Streptomonospora litoralis]|uniref:L-ectoine synthase n=1 Tax=Streptomonospora litoralis TaxID=2498135 RepID=A0A4P6Q2Q4_9ACTN|nr:ectoine synthase [Streptomonospora litoralis]QBI54928.1 L-ectoine synthase [Streptomonospora litoralis]
MIIRDIENVKTVDWGNGLSRRFLLQEDGVGYSITDTIVSAGTRSRLEYRNHLESCYCIEGSGAVIELDGTVHPLRPGRMYSLDKHDAHFLVADPDTDLRLVCVFTPALQGDEAHRLDESLASAY